MYAGNSEHECLCAFGWGRQKLRRANEGKEDGTYWDDGGSRFVPGRQEPYYRTAGARECGPWPGREDEPDQVEPGMDSTASAARQRQQQWAQELAMRLIEFEDDEEDDGFDGNHTIQY